MHGNIYGTSFAALDAVKTAGKICILDIDVQVLPARRRAAPARDRQPPPPRRPLTPRARRPCRRRQGATSCKKANLDCVYVFIAPPSFEELERRLRGRGTESEEKARARVHAPAQLARRRPARLALPSPSRCERVSRVTR